MLVSKVVIGIGTLITIPTGVCLQCSKVHVAVNYRTVINYGVAKGTDSGLRFARQTCCV